MQNTPCFLPLGNVGPHVKGDSAGAPEVLYKKTELNTLVHNHVSAALLTPLQMAKTIRTTKTVLRIP